MNRLTAALAAMAAAVPAAALAETASADSGHITIDGSVAPMCILGEATPAIVDLGTLAATSGPGIGRTATLPPRTVTLPGSFCNFAGSAVKLEANALLATDASVPQPGFARAVNFTAEASGWAATPAVATTSALADGTAPTVVGTGVTQPLPTVADIEVRLSGFSSPGNPILVAGNYVGTVVVTLGPAISE